MNSEAIKGRLSQHVKRRLQSQKSTENKILPLSQNSSPSSATTTPTTAATTPPTLISSLPNTLHIKEEEIETSPVKSVKKRKMTKKSNVQAIESNHAEEDEKCEKRNDKQDNLDVLTLILNHKKSEFLRNPQIVELLSDINKKRCSVSTELVLS